MLAAFTFSNKPTGGDGNAIQILVTAEHWQRIGKTWVDSDTELAKETLTLVRQRIANT